MSPIEMLYVGSMLECYRNTLKTSTMIFDQKQTRESKPRGTRQRAGLPKVGTILKQPDFSRIERVFTYQ